MCVHVSNNQHIQQQRVHKADVDTEIASGSVLAHVDAQNNSATTYSERNMLRKTHAQTQINVPLIQIGNIIMDVRPH